MDTLDIKEVVNMDERRKAQIKANRQKSIQRARDFVAAYFAIHPCTDCGKSNPMILTFDHVRGTKRYNVSDMVRNGLGIETIKAEIEKTEVVCFNCHSLREQERSNAYRWRMNKERS